MGIPKFFNQIFKGRFGHTVTRVVTQGCSSLLIDMNSILHQVAQETFQYGGYLVSKEELHSLLDRLERWREERIMSGADRELIEKRYREQYNALYDRMVTTITIRSSQEWEDLVKKFRANLQATLNRILVTYRPEDFIMITVDGVPPQAKLIQQRSRRFRSTYSKGRDYPIKVFPTAIITPGTEFMERVDQMIRDWISDKNVVSMVGKIYYSSQYIPGEGEHKIMDYIRQGYVYGYREHIILGLDADLIMLSLLAPLNDILLVREKNPFDLHYVQKDVVDINLLREALRRIGITPDDFVLISTLLGNDFLPHHPALDDYKSNMKELLSAYRKLTGSKKGVTLIRDGKINWDRLYRYFEILAEREPELLEQGIGDKSKRVLLVDEVVETRTEVGRTINTLNYSQYRNAWYSDEFSPRSQNREDRQLFQLISGEEEYQVLPEDVNQMTREYLTGMAWVYYYYTRGLDQVKWTWYYPFYHAPLFSDLRDKLDQTSSRLIGNRDWVPTSRSQSLASRFYPIHQLLSVIPLRGNYLIPEKYRQYQRRNLNDYFPVDYLNEMDGRHAKTTTSPGDEWMSILIIPFISTARVIREVKVAPERIKEYLYDPETGLRRETITKVLDDDYLEYLRRRKGTKLPRSKFKNYRRRGRTQYSGRGGKKLPPIRSKGPQAKPGAKLFHW